MAKRKTTKPKAPPAKGYLEHFGVADNTPHGEKCECKPNGNRASGRWLVLFEGQLYGIEPSTQIQKDIWLSDAARTVKKDDAIAMLRWWCFSCRTVQSP